MSHTITSRCVDVLHKGCLLVCPVEAIHYEEGLDRMLYVDSSECIDCRGCIRECPDGAIVPPDELKACDSVWTAVNALWFEDRAAARARVNELAPPRAPIGPR
jgi:Fe-S-cluster-containing hydrogenase component 2